MDKKTFDFNSEIKKLFSDNKKLDVQVRVAGVADTLFCVAHENAGKKFDIVFTESDYLKFSKVITGALKRACAEYSLLLIEDKDFDHAKNKSFFKTCPKGVLAYLFHLMKKRQHQSYVKLALERKPVGGVFNITSEMDVKVFGTVAGFIGGLLQVCFLNIIVIFANCDPFPILNKLQRAVKHKYYDILGPDPCYMLLSRLKKTKITQKVFGKIVKTESFHNNTPFIIL